MNGYSGFEFDGDAESLESLSPFAETPETEGEVFEQSTEAPWNVSGQQALGVEGEEEGKEVEDTSAAERATEDASESETEADSETEAEDEATRRRRSGRTGIRSADLRVPELVALWDLTSALNERVRRLITEALRERSLATLPSPYLAALPQAPLRKRSTQPFFPLLREDEALEYDGPDDRDLIKTLILTGLAENDITNDVFYQRHPDLTGKTLKAGSAVANEWSTIREKEVRPGVRALLTTPAVDPVDLAMFLSQYENDSRVPATATTQFLTRAPLLSMGRSLRDRIISRWRMTKPPLQLDELTALALEISGDGPTAMLLCHNVTKAFARGGVAIQWDRIPSAPGTYTDGKKVWTPEVKHPAGKIVKSFNKKANRDLPSIYYLLFSAKELGTADPGDWYHYYVTATMAALSASGNLGPTTRHRRELEYDRSSDAADAVVEKAYPTLVSDAILSLERQMSNPDLVDQPGYRGWVLANILSYLEGGHYGTQQDDVARESRIHVKGAVAGLRARGMKPGKNWVWYVPGAGSVSKEDLALGIDIRFKTAETIDAAGQRVGPQKKK